MQEWERLQEEERLREEEQSLLVEQWRLQERMAQEKEVRALEVYESDVEPAAEAEGGMWDDGWGASPGKPTHFDYGHDVGFDSDRGPDLLDDAPALLREDPSSPDARAPESIRPHAIDEYLEDEGQTDAGFGALSNILEPMQPIQPVPELANPPAADVTKDDSVPSSPIIPPRSAGRTRAPSLVTRYALCTR